MLGDLVRFRRRVHVARERSSRGIAELGAACAREGGANRANREGERERTDHAESIAQSDAIAYGRYVTEAADCAACHTAPGGKPFTGGRAFVLPFGVLYAPNITPDAATGIAGYTDDESVLAGGFPPGAKFLQKPFTPLALTGKVREVLDAPRASASKIEASLC